MDGTETNMTTNGVSTSLDSIFLGEGEKSSCLATLGDKELVCLTNLAVVSLTQALCINNRSNQVNM